MSAPFGEPVADWTVQRDGEVIHGPTTFQIAQDWRQAHLLRNPDVDPADVTLDTTYGNAHIFPAALAG